MRTINEKELIEKIYQCEKDLYTLEKRKSDIQNTISNWQYIPSWEKSSAYQKFIEQKKPMKYNKSSYSRHADDDIMDSAAGPALYGAGLAIGAFVVLKLFAKFFNSFSHFHHISTFSIVVISLAIFSVFGLWSLLWHHSDAKENKAKMAKENARIEQNERNKEFNQQIESKYRSEYKEEVNRVIARKDVMIAALANERKECEETIATVKCSLDKLYALKNNGRYIVHPNYQGLVPMAVINGYFDTGRCTCLEGHEGAYNLYEDEKFKGMIITRLDNISKQLNQLQGTMEYVAWAINECNDSLYSLTQTTNALQKTITSYNTNSLNQMNSMTEKLDSIGASSLNSEYYSAVTAQMATVNTYYNLLK